MKSECFIHKILVKGELEIIRHEDLQMLVLVKNLLPLPLVIPMSMTELLTVNLTY